MDNSELQSKVKGYLEAFEGRDLDGCLAYFADDATLNFLTSTFRGKKQIEHWHQERFSADLKVIRIDDMTTQDNTVDVEGVITSKRLRAWLVNEISGVVSLTFEDGKIKDARFSWNS